MKLSGDSEKRVDSFLEPGRHGGSQEAARPHCPTELNNNNRGFSGILKVAVG